MFCYQHVGPLAQKGKNPGLNVFATNMLGCWPKEAKSRLSCFLTNMLGRWPKEAEISIIMFCYQHVGPLAQKGKNPGRNVFATNILGRLAKETKSTL